MRESIKFDNTYVYVLIENQETFLRFLGGAETIDHPQSSTDDRHPAEIQSTKDFTRL